MQINSKIQTEGRGLTLTNGGEGRAGRDELTAGRIWPAADGRGGGRVAAGRGRCTGGRGGGWPPPDLVGGWSTEDGAVWRTEAGLSVEARHHAC
jgi:hypothetical protein